jgi:hypothetical protein
MARGVEVRTKEIEILFSIFLLIFDIEKFNHTQKLQNSKVTPPQISFVFISRDSYVPDMVCTCSFILCLFD